MSGDDPKGISVWGLPTVLDGCEIISPLFEGKTRFSASRPSMPKFLSAILSGFCLLVGVTEVYKGCNRYL